MHVGLNLVYLVPGETGGMEVYARELIPALVRHAPGVRFTAFVNREAARAGGAWGEGVAAVTVPVRARNRFEWVRGEQQLLPRLARRAGIDVLHSLATTSPGWGRFRRVVTVHDVIYRLFPEAHFGVRTLGMRAVVPVGVRRAHRIVAISQNTRLDVIRLLKVDPAKIDVVLQGVRPPEEGAPSTPEPELRRRFAVGDRPIVLTVSAKRPVKNLMRLLDALALLAHEERPVLFMPGYPTPYEEELRRHANDLGLEQDTRFLGWVSPENLEGLYRASACFVFPSLYEGFGLPVLEAMGRGVPVACSARGSLEEVSGDAALHFDPDSPRAIADAVLRLIRDAELRDRLAAAGRAWAARFTWDATARGTLAAYERALGTASPASVRS